jgi:hypothetical protein
MAVEDLVFLRIFFRRSRNPREDQVERVPHQRHRLARLVRVVKRAGNGQHVLPVSRWALPIAHHARIRTGRAVGQVDVSDRALVCKSRLVVLFLGPGIQQQIFSAGIPQPQRLRPAPRWNGKVKGDPEGSRGADKVSTLDAHARPSEELQYLH